MAKRLVIALMIVAGSIWGQTPKDAPANEGKPEKADKAAAYYYYALACMYANSSNSADKVEENLKPAIKADPQAPTSVPLAPLPLFLRRPAPSVRPTTPPPQR